MFLKNFKIISNGKIIRDINFHNGVNLVIDLTVSNKSFKETGNNVGKTTFIRAIDFCLGSKGSDLIKDKESNNDTVEVKEFLIGKNVVFELFVENLESKTFKLSRSFVTEFDLFIDDNQFSDINKYNRELNKIFFNLPASETKLSFRNIIKKFVRSDQYSDSNVLKILTPHANDNIYEALYLFLFGFEKPDIISRRLNVQDQIKKQIAALKKIKGKSNLPKFESKLINLNSTIKEKEEVVKTFNLPKTYDNLLNKLNTIKSESTNISSKIASINFKLSLSYKTKKELIESENSIDPRAVKDLYNEAKILIPSIQKSFEEVLTFHKTMVTNKLEYVSKHIDKLEIEKVQLESDIRPILEEQSAILSLLDNSGSFDDLIKVREELNVFYTERGKILAKIEDITLITNKISELEIILDELNEEFSIYLEDMSSNIQEHFNKYLKKFSNSTHGEEIYIYYDKDSRKFEFDNLKGNVGEGYKKTYITSFDFAFIKYFEELGMKFPRFVIHDKLESIHQNQIRSIFNNADSLNGQFLVSILKDKISFLGEEYINSKRILELSQNDKFFKF